MDTKEFDINKAAEMTLALMALGIHDGPKLPGGARIARTWKGFDWDVLSHLRKKGYIGNPMGKAKSVELTPEGLALCRKLFEQHFGDKT